MLAIEASNIAANITPRKGPKYKALVKRIMLCIRARSVGGSFDYKYTLKFEDTPLVPMIVKELCDLGYSVHMHEDVKNNYIILKITW